MFKVSSTPITYTWPVTVYIPRDGGEFTKATFTSEFKVLPQSRVDKIIERAAAGDVDADILTEVLVGWGTDLCDEGGDPMPYSDEAKAKLLDIPYARNAAWRAYMESLAGAARRKN